jgi:F-type H+-transporting ATPase subunit gamma
MSELIHIKRRLKAVETTKKIAHAMQLIARSSHTRLKNQQVSFDQYITSLKKVYAMLTSRTDVNPTTLLQPNSTAHRRLIILIGSQRGLCGSFNNMLIQLYNKYIESLSDHSNLEVIVVGNKTIETLKSSLFPSSIRSFSLFTEQRISLIAQEITRHITSVHIPYGSVVIIGNRSKTFFAQKPEVTTLIPLSAQKNQPESFAEYTLHAHQAETLNDFIPMVIEGFITASLFESLFAEQAARFISMDFATRNAQKLLTEMKLQYNKLRQARITQELIELGSTSSTQ